MWIKWASPAVCVYLIDLQPYLAYVGKPSVPGLVTPEGGLASWGHCLWDDDEFLTGKAPEAKIWHLPCNHIRRSTGQRRQSRSQNVHFRFQAPPSPSSIGMCHRALRLLSAAAPPQPSLGTVWPSVGLELAGLGFVSGVSLGLLGPLLALSFQRSWWPSPGTRRPSFSLWTQSLQSQAPLEAHSVIPFNVFYIVLIAFFVEIKIDLRIYHQMNFVRIWMLIMFFKADGIIPKTVENAWHSDTLRKLIKHHVSPTSATGGFPSWL